MRKVRKFGFRIWDLGVGSQPNMRYENLEVFKEAHSLVLEIYKVTKEFPKEENYRIVDQMIRSAYSIPANIAEGNNRNTTKDYMKFLYTSRGSLNELKYFLLLSRDLKYISNEKFKTIKDSCDSVGKLLNGLINSLKNKK